MKANIYCLYTIKISKWFNLVMPTIVLFYQNMGMSMHEILLLKSIYSVVIVALEIPSGYCADVLGRKKTLVAGSVLAAAGFLIYSTNQLYAGFVLAEIILGIGHSLVSGADSAMLYDTLKSQDRTGAYLKHEGRITSGGNFAEALAGIAGGMLAALSLHMPFYCQTLVAASAIPAALLLKEPSLLAISNRKIRFRRLIHTAGRTLVRNKMLPWTLLVSSLTGTATLTFAWFVQPYFKAAELPLPLYGVMWTLLNLSVGVTGLWAYKFEALLGQKRSIVVLVLLIGGGYLLTGSFISQRAMWVLFFFSDVRGIATPIFKEYIHRYCESEVRATILSLRNFIIRINFAVIGPVLGWVADHHGLQTVFWVAGGVYLAAAGLSMTIPLFQGQLILKLDKQHGKA